MTTLAAITKMAIRANKRKDTLLIERGIGYWITANGAYVPTPPRVSHADVVREIIHEHELTDDDRDQFTRDANTFAIGKGWTRIRIYPGDRMVYADYGHDMQEKHGRLLAELLEHLGFVGYQLRYTNQDGNYVDAD